MNKDRKQILITYDQEGHIHFHCDLEDHQGNMNALAHTLNAVIHRMAGEDKELLYLSILETMQFLRSPIVVNFLDTQDEEVVESAPAD